MKLQDAFVAETGAIGTWTKIGYVIPGSASFSYTDPGAFVDATQGTTDVGALTATIHWQATNNAKLNDCAINSKWQITLSMATGSNGMVDYKAGVNGEGAGKGAVTTTSCLTLTPNFVNLSTVASGT